MASNVDVIIDPKTMKVVFEVNGIQGEGCELVTAGLVGGREVEDSGVTEEHHYNSGLPNYRTD